MICIMYSSADAPHGGKRESIMSKKIFVRVAAELAWAVPAAFVMALCTYNNPGLASPLVLLVVGLRMKVETNRLSAAS